MARETGFLTVLRQRRTVRRITRDAEGWHRRYHPETWEWRCTKRPPYAVRAQRRRRNRLARASRRRNRNT